MRETERVRERARVRDRARMRVRVRRALRMEQPVPTLQSRKGKKSTPERLRATRRSPLAAARSDEVCECEGVGHGSSEGAQLSGRCPLLQNRGFRV